MNTCENYFLTYVVTSGDTHKSSFKLNTGDAIKLKKFLKNLTCNGIGVYQKAEIYGTSFHGRGMEFHVPHDIENDPRPLPKRNVLKENWESNSSIKSWIKFSYYYDITNEKGNLYPNKLLP